MKLHSSRRLAVAAVGTLPILAMYGLHALCAPPGSRATGFLQHDQAYYMANAREMFDGGTFPFYSLPFSPDYTSPTVYFQPLLVVLGTIVRLTSADPGLVYALAGIVACVAAFYLAVVLYDEFAGRGRDAAGWLSRFTFLWGGGVLVLGAVVAERLAPSGMLRGEALLQFDPFQGYWFLNLGRNMFYSTEAFYHAVFFAAVILLLRRRYGAALAALVLESLSHPFTGLQLLAIVAAFCAVETAARLKERPPLWFTAGVLGLLVGHIGYYIVFLNLASSEHRVLQDQWALAWILPLSSMAFAYLPVAVLAGSRFAGTARVRAALRDRHVRLALAWCVVSVALAKHELFLPPRQPLHFTRGYIWTPLALLAAPVFEGALRRLLSVRARPVGALAAAALCLLAISDNAAWFTRIGRQIVDGRSWTLYLPREARLLYGRLAEPGMRERLLVANDDLTAYMALVYTPLRTWYSHPFNTPNAGQRRAEVDAFFAGAAEPPEWGGRRLVVVVNTRVGPPHLEAALGRRGYGTLGRFGRYVLMERSVFK